MLLSTAAVAAPLYHAPDVAPYLRNDTAALASNHFLLQSMLGADAAPSTAGVSLKTSPADFAVADGNVATGALTRWNTVLMAGGGRPTSGAAWFLGLNYAHLVSTALPNLLKDARGEDPSTVVSIGGGSAVFFGGFAVQGVATEVGVFVNGADYTSNDLGEFGAGCSLPQGCGPLRAGAPFPAATPGEAVSVTDRSLLLNVEHRGGHAFGALVSAPSAGAAGLSVLRASSQPYELLPESVGLLGLGLATYAPDVDFYGDQAASRRTGGAAPGRRLWEVPLVGDRLAGTGFLARVTLQAAPTPLLRGLEAGWADEAEVSDRAVVQGGARARLFRRDRRYVPAGDAYVGLFSRSAERPERGVSSYLTFSYNSPDPLAFPAVYDATVLGLQLVAGNPTALPPPVPTVRYPEAP